jgi:hypothetical protein
VRLRQPTFGHGGNARFDESGSECGEEIAAAGMTDSGLASRLWTETRRSLDAWAGEVIDA